MLKKNTLSTWACSSALNRIRLRAIFLHRAFQRLYRNRLTLHPRFLQIRLRPRFLQIRSRFLQIRLGSESCDQISASPNRLKRAKSRDKTTGSLFTRVYTLAEFSQTKRCFFSFLKQNIQRQMMHQHHYRLHNTIHILLKTI